MKSQKVVIFGAGTIGRAFLGRLFGRHGWEIVFIENDRNLVEMLNDRGEYPVVIKRNGKPDEIQTVRVIRAVLPLDQEAAKRELAEAEYIIAAVNRNELLGILPVVAEGILRKFGPETTGHEQSVDFILAEHARAQFIRRALTELLPSNFPLASRVGIVEACVDIVLPVMSDEDLGRDPLAVFTEDYRTFIVDGKGFLNGIPDFEEITAVHSIDAYNDRKLYVHNLGRSAAAYLGYRKYPDIRFIHQALADPEIYEGTRSAMREAAAAVLAEHPTVFSMKDLDVYTSDILTRLSNRGLGDTVHQAGYHVQKKIDRNNRIVGAMRLAEKNGLPYDSIITVFKAALTFQAYGKDGKLSPEDRSFIEKDIPRGLLHVLPVVCGLHEDDPVERKIIARIME